MKMSNTKALKSSGNMSTDIETKVREVDARCPACHGLMQIVMGDLSAPCVDYIHRLVREVAKVAQERMRERAHIEARGYCGQAGHAIKRDIAVLPLELGDDDVESF